MPVIKRYPNRKLYDTEAKRYVTLEHISQMIQAGQDVLVIDHESGEDLTNLTLSQIIFEQEKKGSGFLPRSLLTDLIRAGGDTLEQMRRTLLGTLYLGSHNEAEGEQGAGNAATKKPGEASALQRVDELFQDVLSTLNVPTNRELQRLQTQLDELNAKISELLAEQDAQQAKATAEQVAEENDPKAGE